MQQDADHRDMADPRPGARPGRGPARRVVRQQPLSVGAGPVRPGLHGPFMARGA